MSVVGVDFGTLNTVIAVARNRGVDVVSCVLELSEPNPFMLTMRQITNEVSNRATPYVLALSDRCFVTKAP